MRTRPTNYLLRLFIIAAAGYGLLDFSDLILIELRNLVRPFKLYTLAAGIVGPALAIAAIGLAAANRYLWFAALSALVSLVIFATPVVVFIFGLAK